MVKITEEEAVNARSVLRWLAWLMLAWAMLASVSLLTGIAMLRWEITLGDMLTILLPILSGLGLVIWRLVRRLRPFKAKWGKMPESYDENGVLEWAWISIPFVRSLTIPIGEFGLPIRVIPRAATRFETVEIRCVTRRRWRRHNASEKVIAVTAVWDRYIERGWPSQAGRHSQRS